MQNLDFFKEEVIAVRWHSNKGREYTGLVEYLLNYPVLDTVLRDYKSRNADVTEVTLKDGSKYYFKVLPAKYCTDQDCCEEDHCRCLDFIPTEPLQTLP